jgi:hypothetical protein
MDKCTTATGARQGKAKARQAAKGVCLAPILARTQGTCILGDAMMDAAITGDCSAVVQLSPDIRSLTRLGSGQGSVDGW